jgi:ribonuclease BN (tRNA processing enzyme)
MNFQRRPRMAGPRLRVTVCTAICLLVSISARAQSSAATASSTKVVLLGSGNPRPDPERWGPAVVVNDTAYLVDCGPGVVRRAAAAEKAGIPALNVKKLTRVFITHLHSDHTLGYPDLIFSPWVMHREKPLEAYGPRGLKNMTRHIEKAWEKDIYVRRHGLEQADATGYKVVLREIQPGVVYRDANVTVTAFLVKHGTWDQAFGYRFDTADRRVVIAGDTAPSDEVVKACAGCDVLLHEVYNPRGEKIRRERLHVGPGLRCWCSITRCGASCRRRTSCSRCTRRTTASLFREKIWECIEGQGLRIGALDYKEPRRLHRGSFC